jgi:site-specific DNA recombinase
MRRMFYMVGVEGRSLCAIQKQLIEDGVPSPTGKAQWDIQSIRKLLRRDLYKPHAYAEMRGTVDADVLAGLEPGGKYGVCWFGARMETRKRVSESGESGRVYRYRYTSKVRPVADRIGVPVPGSGIPREWVDATRANLEENRRPANAGRRFWDLSAGILRCSECGRCLRAPRTALTSTMPVPSDRARGIMVAPLRSFTPQSN